MPSQEEVDQALKDALLDPKSTSIDGTTVTNRSLQELIALQEHLDKRDGSNRNHLGIRFRAFQPPGAG